MNAPVVFIYHRVGIDEIDSQLLSVSPGNFESQLAVLSQLYRVVPLYQLIAEVRGGYMHPHTVSLTFDDGYLDNLTNALPILDKFKLHATIFVTSALIGSRQEFWWDALERIFLTCEPLLESLQISDGRETQELDVTSPEGRYRAYDNLCNYLRSRSSEEISRFLVSLFKWAGLENIARPTHRIVDEAGLKRLASSPHIEIGSHGRTHGRLSLMSRDEQRFEIRESKRTLERITGRTVCLFSYPYGTVRDYTEATKKVLKDEGYLAGIANIQGALRAPVDFYAIPRRLVRNWSGEQFSDWLSGEDMDQLEAVTVSSREKNLIEYQYRTVYGNVSGQT